MDHWISDDTIFISRKQGTSDGVVQVYKHTLPDLPLGEYSFSLIGEADTPSAIAPSVAWDHNTYLRLSEFLEYNSAMVTASGHVVLKSQMRIGGRDGPTTYWRCLDLLPMHAFGLLKPVDTGLKPRFLMGGGDVEKAPADDWKSKFETVDNAYNTLMNSYNELNKKWTTRKLENDRLVKDSEAYKKLKDSMQDIKDEAKKSKDTIKDLRDQLKNSVTKTISNELLNKELDNWSVGIAWRCVMDNTKWRRETNPQGDAYYRVAEMPSKYNNLEDAHFCGEFKKFGNWKVYRKDGKVTFICDQLYMDDPSFDSGPRMWKINTFYWESKENSTRRLYAEIYTFSTYR